MPELEQSPPALIEFALDMASESVADLDVPELLERTCAVLTELYQLAGCAAVLHDSTGSVRILVGSHPAVAQLTRLMRELDNGNGHHEDTVEDLTRSARLDLAQVAAQVGLPITGSVALHGPGGLTGQLRLFGASPGALTDELLARLRPFADVLGAVLDNTETYQHSASTVGKLSEHRPVEQAKGILAERHQIDLDAAYRMLREQARRHDTTVLAVAGDLVEQSWRDAKPVPEQAATPAPEHSEPAPRT